MKKVSTPEWFGVGGVLFLYGCRSVTRFYDGKKAGTL